MTNPPDKKCINCKNRGCNINQGWAWCERQNPYFFMTDGAFCAEFVEQPDSVTTTATLEKVSYAKAKNL